MHLEPIKRELVSDKVIEQIKVGIDNGKFKAGDRLPPETEMARSLNVGRSTVREALKVLIHLGILERKGRNTVVAEDPFNNAFLLHALARYRDNQNVVEMIEVRRFLEVQLCELAAERADEADIRDLEACVRQMQTDDKDCATFIQADQSFHLILARAAKNKVFFQMMESIRMSLEKTVELIIRHRPDIVPKSMRYHEEILNAIARHQIRKARKAMKGHLQDIESEFKRILRGK